jgi:hypothetical protein
MPFVFLSIHASSDDTENQTAVLEDASVQRTELLVVIYVHVTVHRNKFLFNETNQMNKFPKFYFVKKLYIFRAFPLLIIRSFLLYIRHWYISCRYDDSFQAGSK